MYWMHNSLNVSKIWEAARGEMGRHDEYRPEQELRRRESFLHDYHIDEEENSETYESTQKQYAKN